MPIRHIERSDLALIAGLIMLLGWVVPANAQSASSGRPIRGILLERENVYPVSEAQSLLPRLTNALHRTTRAWVIRRELLFSVGEFYDSAKVAETARNLRSRGVFRFVAIDSVPTDSGLVMRVHTGDGWSTKISPNFGRTSNKFVGSISLVEENLLGTAILASLSLRKDVDRSSLISLVSAPRLIGGSVDVAAQAIQFRNSSDGRIYWGRLGRPFRSLSSRTAWSLTGQDERRRILRFFEGESVASDTAQRRFSVLAGSVGWAPRASPSGYTRLGLWVEYRRENFVTEAAADSIGFPRNTFGTFGVSLEWRRARFLVTRSFRGLDREEDVDVSTTVRLGLAVTSQTLGYNEDGVVPSIGLRTGFVVPSGFGYLNASAYRRLSSASDSGAVQIAGTVLLQPGPRHAAVFYLGGGWLKGSRPGGEFDLGADFGPRGYRAHAFTGERAFFGTAEYRYMVTEDFLNLWSLGIAAFIDYGGAWYAGNERRAGWDAGIGLRIGNRRSIELETNRWDLVRCFGRFESFCGTPGGFALVVAKGFPFSTSGNLR